MADAAAGAVAPRGHSRDYWVGIGLLMLVVLLWTGSNFLTNSVLTSGWDKPWAVTYANTSSFTLYMLPFIFALRSRREGRRRTRDGERKSVWAKLGFALPASPRSLSPTSEEEESLIASRERPAAGHRLRPVSPDARPRLGQGGRPSSIDGRRPVTTAVVDAPTTTAAAALPPLTLRETAILAAQFTIVWFLANYCLNASLALTSVASSTTLSSASGFFTLALGSATGVERFSAAKLVAVCVSFVGVVLVTHADAVAAAEGAGGGEGGVSGSAAFAGDALALLSAFFYALYVTLLKVRIQSEDRVSMPLFFGFVGVFNTFCLWPVGLLLSFLGVEQLQLPPDGRTWAGIVTNMGITFVSDFAYLVSMLKTAPLVATVGLSLTIPLAVVIDVLRGTHSGGWRADVGSAAVLLSFVTIGWDDSRAEQ